MASCSAWSVLLSADAALGRAERPLSVVMQSVCVELFTGWSFSGEEEDPVALPVVAVPVVPVAVVTDDEEDIEEEAAQEDSDDAEREEPEKETAEEEVQRSRAMLLDTAALWLANPSPTIARSNEQAGQLQLIKDRRSKDVKPDGSHLEDIISDDIALYRSWYTVVAHRRWVAGMRAERRAEAEAAGKRAQGVRLAAKAEAAERMAEEARRASEAEAAEAQSRAEEEQQAAEVAAAERSAEEVRRAAEVEAAERRTEEERRDRQAAAQARRGAEVAALRQQLFEKQQQVREQWEELQARNAAMNAAEAA